MQTEFNQKGEQCEETCEQLKDQQEQRILARKQMLKLTFEQKKESTLLETLRFDKENCERQLVAAKVKTRIPINKIYNCFFRLRSKGWRRKSKIWKQKGFS